MGIIHAASHRPHQLKIFYLGEVGVRRKIFKWLGGGEGLGNAKNFQSGWGGWIILAFKCWKLYTHRYINKLKSASQFAIINPSKNQWTNTHELSDNQFSLNKWVDSFLGRLELFLKVRGILAMRNNTDHLIYAGLNSRRLYTKHLCIKPRWLIINGSLAICSRLREIHTWGGYFRLGFWHMSLGCSWFFQSLKKHKTN